MVFLFTSSYIFISNQIQNILSILAPLGSVKSKYFLEMFQKFL